MGEKPAIIASGREGQTLHIKLLQPKDTAKIQRALRQRDWGTSVRRYSGTHLVLPLASIGWTHYLELRARVAVVLQEFNYSPLPDASEPCAHFKKIEAGSVEVDLRELEITSAKAIEILQDAALDGITSITPEGSGAIRVQYTAAVQHMTLVRRVASKLVRYWKEHLSPEE